MARPTIVFRTFSGSSTLSATVTLELIEQPLDRLYAQQILVSMPSRPLGNSSPCTNSFAVPSVPERASAPNREPVTLQSTLRLFEHSTARSPADTYRRSHIRSPVTTKQTEVVHQLSALAKSENPKTTWLRMAGRTQKRKPLFLVLFFAFTNITTMYSTMRALAVCTKHGAVHRGMCNISVHRLSRRPPTEKAAHSGRPSLSLLSRTVRPKPSPWRSPSPVSASRTGPASIRSQSRRTRRQSSS